MKKIICMAIIWIVIKGVIYPQEEDSNTEDKNWKNSKEWDKNIWDLRMFDVPRIGLFYELDNNEVLYRISLPISFPVVLITPISFTYANSYFGIDILLFDTTFGIRKINFVRDLRSDKFSDKFIEFSQKYLLRFFPISLWAGIPLSSKGFGVNILIECAPLNIFSNEYSNENFGIGLNIGFKVITTEYFDFDIKYENYINYNDINKRIGYVGIYFNYRLLGSGNYTYFDL
jgi:hypothetical protein